MDPYSTKPSAPSLAEIEELSNEPANQSIDAILTLPYSEHKRKLIDNNLDKLLTTFSDAVNVPYIIVNSENKYTVLKNVCVNKTPKQVEHQMRTIFGKTAMLRAKYADKLLSAIADIQPEANKYMYIHAIGPYVLDPWNCKYNHGVFRCYYKNGDDLTQCPLTSKLIFEVWHQSVKGNRYYSKVLV